MAAGTVDNPAALADAQSAPMQPQLIVGESIYAQSLAAALEAAGVDVTTRILPGEGHAFDLDEDGSLSPTGEALAPDILIWLRDHVG